MPPLVCFRCLTEICEHLALPGARYKHPPREADTPRAVTMFQGTALCGGCALAVCGKMLEQERGQTDDQASQAPAQAT